MRKRLAISVAVVLAFAAVAVGCGGDDDADAGAASGDAAVETSSLSKAQYVKQADGLCARERQATLRRFIAYAKQAGGKDPEGIFEAASRRILAPSLERQANAIRSLGAPSGDEQQIEALLEEIERASDALAAEPPSGAREYEATLRHSAELAQRYGFIECGAATLV